MTRVVGNSQDGSGSAPATPSHLHGHSCDFDFQPGDQSAVLVVLSVNDVHDMLPGHDGRGGIATLATLLDRERAKVPEDATVIVTLNGDFLNGTEMGQRLQGEHSIELIHHVGIDYVVPGNHEFDFGEKVLRQRIKSSQFTWLGANVVDKSTGGLLDGFMDTQVVELQDGLRLGLFGVVTPETPNTSNPGDNIEFEDYVTTARHCVDKLRSGPNSVDFIIALTHMHLQDDKALARQVPEIDLILGGHDHEPYTLYEGRTLIHKSGQNALWLAKLEFELTKSAAFPERPLSVTPQWSMIVNQHIRAQPECEQIVVKYLRKLVALEGDPAETQRVLATVEQYPLSTQTILARSGASNMSNLVADALRSEMETQYAVINGGFIRGDTVYNVGDKITVGVLDHEMPFPRPAVALEIKVRDFVDALQQQFAMFPQVSSSYPHISGFRLTFDRTTAKIVNVADESTREPLDFDAVVTVATTDFVAHGGDACIAWRRGEIVRTGDRVATVVGKYLEKIKQIAYSPTEQRIEML